MKSGVYYRSKGAETPLKESTHSMAPLPTEHNPLHTPRPSCLRCGPLAPPVPELSQRPGVPGSSALSAMRSRGIPCLGAPLPALSCCLLPYAILSLDTTCTSCLPLAGAPVPASAQTFPLALLPRTLRLHAVGKNNGT